MLLFEMNQNSSLRKSGMFIEAVPLWVNALQRSAMLGIVCHKDTQTQRVRRKNLHGTPPECCFRVDPDYKHLTPPE